MNKEDESPIIRALRDNITRLEAQVVQLEKKLQDHERILRGDASIGFVGLKEHITTQVTELKEEIKAQRGVLDGLEQEKRSERDQKAGMKRLVGYSGVTNLATFITLAILLYQSST